MIFDHPTHGQLPQLLALWKEAFGEHNGFWELFLETAFLPDHCRCIVADGQIAASLCWMDCTCQGQPMAYVYAVVTHPVFRGRGLCRKLLEEVHGLLKTSGYAAALLVPDGDTLRQMYRKLGYADATCVSEFTVAAGASPVPLQAIGPELYGRLRREFLPEGSVQQEGRGMDFLARQAQFYLGPQVLLAAYWEDGVLYGMELLGDKTKAPGIVTALDCKKGHFRTPGPDTPFAMAYPLTQDAKMPRYFGFAFD